MASKLVSPIDSRASLRSLAAAVEKSLKRTSAVAWACRSAGVAAAARMPGSGCTGRATTLPPWRASQEAASQARPRAPSGPWLAQQASAAASRDSFHGKIFSRGRTSIFGKIGESSEDDMIGCRLIGRDCLADVAAVG